MNESVYGYLIGSDIQVDVTLGVVTRAYLSRKTQNYDSEGAFLSETAMSLLVFLLENAQRDVVPSADILFHVWDKRGLVSSYKRLNQVVNTLRQQLMGLGLMEDFIITVRGRGYRLNCPAITTLYSVASARRSCVNIDDRV